MNPPPTCSLRRVNDACLHVHLMQCTAYNGTQASYTHAMLDGSPEASERWWGSAPPWLQEVGAPCALHATRHTVTPSMQWQTEMAGGE
jgi:hypothetical protein